jgi:hypothetical protein
LLSLLASCRLTNRQAFDLLSAVSQKAHSKMREIAADVVLTDELRVELTGWRRGRPPLDPGADGHLPHLTVIEGDVRRRHHCNVAAAAKTGYLTVSPTVIGIRFRAPAQTSPPCPAPSGVPAFRGSHDMTP